MSEKIIQLNEGIIKDEMLVFARLCHVTGTQWGVKQYMNMKYLENYSTEESESENLAGNSWLPDGKINFAQKS